MSLWRIFMREIAESEEGWLPTPYARSETNFDSAVRMGFLRAEHPGQGGRRPIKWHLTQRGRDYLEGRVDIAITQTIRADGVPWRGKMVPAATWLQALPRANEIRLPPPPQRPTS